MHFFLHKHLFGCNIMLSLQVREKAASTDTREQRTELHSRAHTASTSVLGNLANVGLEGLHAERLEGSLAAKGADNAGNLRGIM